jgi:predicted dehydrogenase
MQSIRVGVIGIQGFGRRHAEILKPLPTVQLQAACDVQSEPLAAFARQYGIPQTYTDYRDMLSSADIDCVTIATPHHLHRQMVMDALHAGKHVLCEKPLAIRAADADDMAAMARQKNLKLACHYIFRLSPPIAGLQQAITQGLLGDVYYVSMRWLARHTGFWFSANTGWRVSKEQAGGGILMGRGSHLIDAMWWALGKPRVASVSAMCSSQLLGQPVEDFAAATITLADGCRMHLECSYGLHLPEMDSRHEYEVYGTKAGAVARLSGASPGLYMGKTGFPAATWTDLPPTAPGPGQPASVIEDFILSIIEDRTPLVSGADAAVITRIVEAAYRSANEQREIVVTSE